MSLFIYLIKRENKILLELSSVDKKNQFFNMSIYVELPDLKKKFHTTTASKGMEEQR
jgi:hypothetical protein